MVMILQGVVKMRAQWMTLKRAGGQGDRPHYQKYDDNKNLHAMIQQAVNESLKQKQKKYHAGSVHFASEVAIMPEKSHDDDDDDNIEYGEKNLELAAFNEMHL
jgi:hypothetical protein